LPTGLFFTGTDTGAGKTFVLSLVLRLLRSQHRPVAVCKPVATGAEQAQGRWLSDDTRQLAEAAGVAGRWDEVTPWSFPDPVAPPVAARRAGTSLKLADIVAAVQRRARPGVPLLVEGVGGLLCPLTDRETVADLAAELRLPLIVVARRALGTLNHTLLTLEVARGRNLPVAGVVLAETQPPSGLAEQTNVEELRRRGVPVLTVVPHRSGAGFGNFPEVAMVDWWELCCGLRVPDPQSAIRNPQSAIREEEPSASCKM
jgi:dethiobiotin synthetase